VVHLPSVILNSPHGRNHTRATSLIDTNALYR